MQFLKVGAATIAAMLSLAPTVFAQSTPGLTKGQVPTAGQWNNFFASKQDALGYTPINSAGGVMTGRLITAPPGASTSGLNLTPGSTPAAPVNGDLWMTSSGFFARVNGVTIGPIGGATSSSFAGTSPITVSFPAGVTTYACATCGIIGNPLSQFAATTSAQLAGVVSDETGTGPLVFGNNPTITLANGTGLPVSTGISGLGTGIATWLATPSSANLLAALTTKTGTGNAVFGTAPTIAGGSVTGLTTFSIRSSGSGAFDLQIQNVENLTAGRALTIALNDASRVIQLGGNLILNGALTMPAIAQGDVLYGSAAGVVSALAKNTTATRYLSNTGGSNNPQWNAVDLTNGVSNTLQLASITSGTQDTLIGYFSSTVPSAGAVPNCTGALTYSTGTHSFGCNATAGTGNVVNSGTPTANQIAQWTNATTIQGVNLASLLVAGSGITITGTTSPTIAILTPALTIISPAVGGGVGTSPTMQGWGSVCKITPVSTGRVRFVLFYGISNNTPGNTTAYNARYGTGAAPAFGAGTTGNPAPLNTMGVTHATAGAVLQVSSEWILTALTLGTPVWFDGLFNSSANTSTAASPNCIAQEY
jgi:hypothetical protein